MFQELIRREVEDETGSWSGSIDQNQLADMKIASSVRNSLKAYEKNRKNFEESYFKF